MEVNKKSADAEKPKIRRGTGFVSKRTDNFKYVDKDGSECWVVPMSRYYAIETILRGQPIAICQPSDLEDTDRSDAYPYVKVYNPNKDDFCIGIATCFAEKYQIVQIQNKGKFSYLTTKSKKAIKEGEDPREVYIDASKGWLFDELRGQTIYVSAQETTGFPNAHDSKVSDADNKKILTYDFIDSVYTTKNTIQLGHLTDAPTTTEDGDQVVTLELDVTGDTRGPLDNTQFILTLGEDITFEEGNPKADLGLNGNEGIFNEVKAVAMSKRNPTEAELYTIQRNLQSDLVLAEIKAGENPFVAIRKLNGKVVIIPSVAISDLKELDPTSANDRAFLSLTELNASEIIICDPVNTLGELTEAIKTALKDNFEEFENLTDSTKPSDDGHYIKAGITGGWFDIYESQILKAFFNVKTVDHGCSAIKGTAVLADIRDFDRTNVIGVVLSNQPGVHPYNDPEIPNTIRVLRQGRFVTKGKLVPGAEYYLFTDGRLTTKPQIWYDTCVKIGTAENEHTLLVDVQEVQHDYTGATPIGFIKPCADGNVPEKGFILADGVTEYKIEQYSELLDYLLGFYTKEELQLNETTFIIPRILMDCSQDIDENGNPKGSAVGQIKYTVSGIYSNMPRAPFMRFNGEFAEGKIPDFDITRLVHYGTLEQGRVAPTLENIDIRLFYYDPTTENFPNDDRSHFADSYAWREIQPGFFTYNNDTLYGFEWIVMQDEKATQDGMYNLHMNIADGMGVCKVGGHRGPVNLNGKKFKLLVTAKNLWTREYSLLDEQAVSLSMDIDTNAVAPSVNAVKKYYKERVETNNLEAVKGHVEELEADKISVKEKGGVTYKEEFNEHTSTDASKNEVHGIKNAGVSGNIDAAKLAGLSLGAGGENVTPETKFGTKDYIPFVSSDPTTGNTTLDAANVNIERDANGSIIATKSDKFNSADNSLVQTTKAGKAISKVVNDLEFGNNKLEVEIKPVVTGESKELQINVAEVSDDKEVVVKGLKSIEVSDSVGVGSRKLTESDLEDLATLTHSSISYKEVNGECINKELKELIGEDKNLTPNSLFDIDGKKVVVNEDGKKEMPFEEEMVDTFVKFGSALQALYELPLSSWDYTYEKEDYKEQLGILVERVNQVVDKLGGSTNYGHNFNTDKYNNQESFNRFNYTEEEIASICNYLSLVTNKKELGMELRSTVAILLKAAQETQQRLLDVESSVYGIDAKNIPGDGETNKAKVLDSIDESLRDDIINTPLMFGLNRLVRAICLELFDTTDLEQIEAETLDHIAGSENEDVKTTIKSRLDIIDDYLSDNLARINGLTRLYEANFTRAGMDNIVLVNEGTLTKVESAEAVIGKENKLDIGTTYTGKDRTTLREESDSWGTLPSKEEYNSFDTTYATKSDLEGTHFPTEKEIEKINVPVTEDIELDELLTGSSEHKEVMHLIKFDHNTGLPITKEEAVVFLESKVERLNLKLSELTKVIYGRDEVLANPNTIETIKRDIKSIINDLYPNQNLDNVDAGDDLLNPFKRTADKLDLLGEGVWKTDELNSKVRKGIIPELTKELYFYSVPMDYATQAYDLDNKYKSILSTEPGTVKAVAPELNSAGNLKRYSSVDLLNDVIGVKYTYNPTLFYAKNLLLQYGENILSTNVGNSQFSSSYKDELTYYEGNKEDGLGEPKVSGNIEYSKTKAVLDRKSKTLSARISTIESALDALADTFTKLKKEENINDIGSTAKGLVRFEEDSPFANEELKKTFEKSITHYLPYIEDIVYSSVDNTLKHNLDILTDVLCSNEIVSVDAFKDYAKRTIQLKDNSKVYIEYVDNAPAELDGNTIYLHKTILDENTSIYDLLKKESFDTFPLKTTSTQKDYLLVKVLENLVKEIDSSFIKLDTGDILTSTNGELVPLTAYSIIYEDISPEYRNYLTLKNRKGFIAIENGSDGIVPITDATNGKETLIHTYVKTDDIDKVLGKAFTILDDVNVNSKIIKYLKKGCENSQVYQILNGPKKNIPQVQITEAASGTYYTTKRSTFSIEKNAEIAKIAVEGVSNEFDGGVLYRTDGLSWNASFKDITSKESSHTVSEVDVNNHFKVTVDGKDYNFGLSYTVTGEKLQINPLRIYYEGQDITDKSNLDQALSIYKGLAEDVTKVLILNFEVK